jgi:hypothetical protein
MPEKSWKQYERRVAAIFGAHRTPLSGGNSRHGTRSDVLHPTLYIECKFGSSVPQTWRAIEALFEDVVRNATLEGKMPVLVCHRKNAHGGVEEDDAYIQMDAPMMGGVRPVCVPLRVVKRIAEGLPRR